MTKGLFCAIMNIYRARDSNLFTIIFKNMSREKKGGHESGGNGVDFDSILASVVEEAGAEAEGKVLKAEKRKKSKVDQSKISGELGSHLQDLAKKEGGESEEELTATAFNFLIYSEFGNKKVPKAVQAKLDVYNQAKEGYSNATAKMGKLPDEFQADPRLLGALDDLKSKMVVEARELATELGVNYEEIASGELALLGTEEEEIARLREEADKLSPGRVEFAKESYEDYKERISGVLVERMSKLIEQRLLPDPYSSSPHDSGKDKPEKREAIEVSKVAIEVLAEEELKKIFEKIEQDVEGEKNRRQAIVFLEREFGALIPPDRAPNITNFISSVDTKNNFNFTIKSENAEKIPTWIFEAAFAETRIKYLADSLVNKTRRGARNIKYSGALLYSLDLLRKSDSDDTREESFHIDDGFKYGDSFRKNIVSTESLTNIFPASMFDASLNIRQTMPAIADLERAFLVVNNKVGSQLNNTDSMYLEKLNSDLR